MSKNTCFEPKIRSLGHFWRFRAALVSRISGLRLVETPYPSPSSGRTPLPLQHLWGGHLIKPLEKRHCSYLSSIGTKLNVDIVPRFCCLALPVHG